MGSDIMLLWCTCEGREAGLRGTLAGGRRSMARWSGQSGGAMREGGGILCCMGEERVRGEGFIWKVWVGGLTCSSGSGVGVGEMQSGGGGEAEGGDFKVWGWCPGVAVVVRAACSGGCDEGGSRSARSGRVEGVGAEGAAEAERDEASPAVIDDGSRAAGSLATPILASRGR